MNNSKFLRRLLIASTFFLLLSVIAGVYTHASKNQKKQKDHLRTYEAAKVTAAPEVKSIIKDLEISSVSLIGQGTAEAAVAIDVINNRDEDVMAVDFIAGRGKSTSGGVAMDGLLREDDPLVIIPRHSLKTFTWHLGSFLEGESIFLAAAIFSDGKEKGDKLFVDGLKKSRIDYQERRRKNGGPK